ncbi:MAG: membrane dipeptidase [Bacteroidetes bacterium]|nr:membrane dipeptidase [Bacteroidota bacterium]
MPLLCRSIRRPCSRSHSTSRHVTPGWLRNMSDKMITTLGANGGLIMVNFGSSFLSNEVNEYRYDRGDAYRAHLWENGIEGSDEQETRSTRPGKRNMVPFHSLI